MVGPRILFTGLFSNTISLCCHNVTDQVSRSYKTTGNILLVRWMDGVLEVLKKLGRKSWRMVAKGTWRKVLWEAETRILDCSAAYDDDDEYFNCVYLNSC
jgi:hypothetical protein